MLDSREIGVIIGTCLVSYIYMEGLIKSAIILYCLKKYEGRVVARVISVRVIYGYHIVGTIYNFFPKYRYMVNDVTYEGEFPIGYRKNRYPEKSKVILHYDIRAPEKFVPEEEKFWKRSFFTDFVQLLVFVSIAVYGSIIVPKLIQLWNIFQQFFFQ